MAKRKKPTEKKESSNKRANRFVPTKSGQLTAKTANAVWQKGFWGQNWLPALIIFALGIGLYISTVSFKYVLDDSIVYSKNNFVKKGFGGIKDILTKESMEGYFGEQKNIIVGGRYRPLSLVTFAMEYALSHDPSKKTDKALIGKKNECPECNPAVGHFINALFYGLTGLLLFRVLSLMFPKKKEASWFLGMAFVASLLWICHPIHSECVANIKGRDEIMTLMGALATLYFSWRYAHNGKFIWLLLSGVLFLLALLAKENALTFLAVIPLSIYFFSETSFKRIIVSTIPLFIAAGVYLSMRYQAIGYFLDSGKAVTDLMNNPFTGMTVGTKFATIFYTLLLYLKLLIFPHPLTHDYYPFQIPTMQWSNIASILSLVIHLGLGVFALIGLRTKNIFAYCIWFYVATLSIVSNIPFTVGTTMNERFIYISSIGFCIALAYIISRFLPSLKDGKLKGLSMAILAIFTIGFIAKTIERTPAWKDTISLNKAAIKVSTNSARANCFMGTAIFEYYRDEAKPEEKQALLKESSDYVNRALEIHPKYGSALVMKSGIVAEEYKYDRDLDKLLNSFDFMLRNKKNLSFIEEYIVYLIPRADKAKLSAFCYKMGNDHFLKLSDYQYAIKYLTFGIQNDPNHALMNLALSRAYQGLGNNGKAQEFANKAAQLNPSIIR